MVETKVIIDSEKLKDLREKYKYSISDVAYMLGYKTPTGYWCVESNKRKVTIDTLYRLAEIYSCHMEELVKLVPVK